MLSVPCIVLAMPPHNQRALIAVGLALCCAASFRHGKPLWTIGAGVLVGLFSGLMLVGFGADIRAYGNMAGVFSVMGLVIGITCWIAGILFKHVSVYICFITVPCIAVLVEYLSAYIFPVSLSLTQHNSFAALLIVQLTGAWGITWLIWLCAISIALSFATRARWLILAAVLLIAADLYVGETFSADSDASTYVAAVQARTPDEASGETSKLPEYVEYVAWPEHIMDAKNNTAAISAASYQKYIAASFSLASRNGRPVNSARLYGPDGNVLLESGKKHRFGKEIFIYQKGVVSKPVDVGEGIRIGVPVCFDLIYPDVARKLASEGANLLLVPNSDPNSPGFTFQHIHRSMVALRAAENAVPIVWAEVNGLSTVFDDSGAVVSESANDTVYAAVSIGRRQTVYTRWGDWFVFLCSIPVISVLLRNIRLIRPHI